MSTVFILNADEADKLLNAVKEFPDNSEKIINNVLHNEGASLIQDSIRLLIPVSGRTWKGKSSPAKSSNSLRSTDSNLAVTVRSQKKYQYLYYPDDGTNTRRHVGNQQFFLKGAENVSSEIIDKCIKQLTNKFEEGD